MPKTISSILFLMICVVFAHAQTESKPDFKWGNTSFFNLNVGDTIHFLNTDIQLISIENRCNKLKIGEDTIDIKMSQRNPVEAVGGLSIYVADNHIVKNLSLSPNMHGLLTKNVLVGISNFSNLLINNQDYVFPVAFNEGFVWNLELDIYPFSFVQTNSNAEAFIEMPGVEFDLQDNTGEAKHWMVAIENSKVVWINETRKTDNERRVDALLESESQPGIYYYYGNLSKRNIEVRENQNLRKGELIGTVHEEKGWGNSQFLVIKNDTVPEIEDVQKNIINFFPQLFELYFNRSYGFSRTLSKGDIKFGRSEESEVKNDLEFVNYIGTGWKLGCWNVLRKVPVVEKNGIGNVRLSKVLFQGSAYESVNPNDYYEFEINVKNGLYRARVELGDVELKTWQEVEFEGRSMGQFTLEKGKLEWTNERAVTVTDGKLTIRIYVDPEGTPAGFSEFVFIRLND